MSFKTMTNEVLDYLVEYFQESIPRLSNDSARLQIAEHDLAVLVEEQDKRYGPVRHRRHRRWPRRGHNCGKNF